MISKFIWFMFFLLVVYVFLTGWFFALSYARNLRDKGTEFSKVVIVPLFIFLGIGVVADFIFNAIIGTVMFRHLPKEWLFTQRIKRNLNHESDWRKRKAQVWAIRLNKIDPGHV